MKMRIVIVQGAFMPIPPLLGGAVEKMWYVLGLMFAQQGNEVVHVSRKYSNLPVCETRDKVTYLRVPGFDFKKNIFFLKFCDLLYTLNTLKVIPRDADIVITNTFFAPLIYPFFRSSKIYVDVARMPKGQMRFYAFAARLRANSTSVADAIYSEIARSRHSQVHMIPNPLPSIYKESVNLDVKEPTVLYCGLIHPEKGLNILAQLVKELPISWKLRIVGPVEVSEGGGGSEYLLYLKRLLGSDVEFAGPFYDDEQLNAEYRRASIFVYPSVAEKGETFGLAPLEAMAWGCVPVVSNLSCFKDFITDNVNGHVFDHRASDAEEQLARIVVRLIENKDLWTTMANKSTAVRESHSVERIAKQFLNDFESLVVK